MKIIDDMYVMLCDEDGNEEEFEIMHYMKHEGHIYIVLADEDYETFLPAEKIGDECFPVEDDIISAMIQQDFNNDMRGFMSGLFSE